jgi:dienelactone hydrolase
MEEKFTTDHWAMGRQSAKVLVGLMLVLALSLQLPVVSAQSESPANAAPLRWLILGPIPSSGSNALFVDYLSNPGGEAHVHARKGEMAAINQSGALRWQAANSDQDGRIDFKKMWPDQKRAIAYAYTELQSNAERYAVATIGSGDNIQVRLNGDIVFESRLSRKPELDKDTLVLRLHKGANPLLVKIEGDSGDWSLQWKTHFPNGKLFVNEHATIIPDFRAGASTNAWGQVEVANASGDALTDVAVEIAGDDLVLPSRCAQTIIRPGEVQRIPFWVASRKAAPESAAPIRLRVASGSEEQLVNFAPRIRKAADFFVTTYRSMVDDSVQPYSLLLPTSFDSAATYPLIALLHGAHVTDWGQNMISYDPKEWAIQVAVHDRGNNRYRDIGEVDLEEVLADVKRRFHIDPDRMYLSGHSMGGYGTWFQAVRHPDRWAAISPQAGYTDYSLYNPAMRDAHNAAQRKFEEQLIEDWSPLTFAENLLHVPAYIVHGAKDDNVSVEHSRKMAARLSKLGYTYIYDENPEGGHWWGPRGKYYGVEVVDKPPIWTFFQKHSRRMRAPKHVIYQTASLRYREAYWVAIDELDVANHLARIEAEVAAPNAIAVHLDNTKQFTLRLGDDDLVKRDQPVKVSVGNQVIFNALLPLSARLTLRREDDGRYVQILDDADLHIAARDASNRSGFVEAKLGEAGSVARYAPRDALEPLKKTAQVYGPVIDAFDKPFLFVISTAGRDSKSIELQDAARRAAEAQARDWTQRANGIVQIKQDMEVTRDDIASRNLILFGNARTNRLIAQINDELPIKFNVAGLVVGEHAITGEDLGLIMAVPNPLNAKRYVVIVGGTTPQSFETAGRLPLTDLPDYVIFDRQTLAGKDVNYVGGGFFDKFWHLDNSTQISKGGQ